MKTVCISQAGLTVTGSTFYNRRQRDYLWGHMTNQDRISISVNKKIELTKLMNLLVLSSLKLWL